MVSIRWRSRKIGTSSRIEEQGSRDVLMVLDVWLGFLLTRGDHARPIGSKFEPWQSGDRARA